MLSMFATSKIDLPVFHFFPLVFSVYAISKDNKSDDGEGNDSTIASVVKKILEDSGTRNMKVNAFRTFFRKRYQSSIQRSGGLAKQEEKP